MAPRVTKFGNRVYLKGTKVDLEGHCHRSKVEVTRPKMYLFRLEKDHTSVHIVPPVTKFGKLQHTAISKIMIRVPAAMARQILSTVAKNLNSTEHFVNLNTV